MSEEIIKGLSRKQMLNPAMEGYKQEQLSIVTEDLFKHYRAAEVGCLESGFDIEAHYTKMKIKVQAKKYIERMYNNLEKEREKLNDSK